jgi:hypothetical protein
MCSRCQTKNSWLLAYQMFRFVVFADILEQFFLRSQIEFQIHMKRFDVRAGVFEGHGQFQVAEIHAPVAFGHVQHFGVRQRASTQAA